MMKSLLSVMAFCAMLLPLGGCETLPDTAAENRVRVLHSQALNLRALNNDLEYILYIDRPMWLSRYPIPND
jgi:hypothetical protein